MADTAPSGTQGPASKGKGLKGKGLTATWHGVPVWVLGITAGGGGLFVYRWYKARKGASSATSSLGASGANPAATGAGSGLGGGYTGTGTGGGGGGTTSGAGAAGTHRKKNPLLPPDTSSSGSGGTTSGYTGPTNPDGSPTLASLPGSRLIPATGIPPGWTAAGAPGWMYPTPTSSSPTSGNASAPASSPNAGQPGGATPVATEGSTATGAGGNPNGTAGSFALSKGTVNFQPTAAVRNGNQVAYGIPDQGTATTVQNAGGTVESGKTLMSKGWSNLTAGALYLLR